MSDAENAHIRAASRQDVPAVLALMAAGFETYRRFAPEDWQPPEQDRGAALAIEYIVTHPQTWYVVAEDAAGHAGQCGFHPAHEERMMRGRRIEGLAHFWQLFVREDLWGSGLGGRLHDLSVEAMRERGFTRARLNTPAGQARARRFYERRGWRSAGPSPDGLGSPAIELLRYELDLASGSRGS
jgi:GNAT superfamily N-acetyltransferase